MKRTILLLTTILALAWLALAQAPAAAPAGSAPLTTEDLKSVEAPKADARANGDPDGSLTGTVADVAVSDAKKGLTIGDVVNQVGQNKIAINFVWTLIAGFLVMFMQAGFAMVETGLCRAKNANHTMMMNFMVYGIGMLAYWLIGFAIQMGGVGGVGNLGGAAPLNTEWTITLFGKPFGLFGQNGLFLTQGGTYDVGVMVVFLFQMVFMDTALTIVTGSAAERWKYAAFLVSSFIMGAFTYPLFANWAWGGGWLANLGANFGLGKGYCDFAGSGVVHAVGGLSALALAIIIGPRLGKFTRQGKPNAHHRARYRARAHRLLHPGVRLVRVQSRLHAGRVRQRQPAHRLDRGQHHAGRHGRRFRRDVLHVDALRQAGRLHVRQRPAGRAGGDHRTVRFRQHGGRGDHRPDRRRAGVPVGGVRGSQS